VRSAVDELLCSLERHAKDRADVTDGQTLTLQSCGSSDDPFRCLGVCRRGLGSELSRFLELRADCWVDGGCDCHVDADGVNVEYGTDEVSGHSFGLVEAGYLGDADVRDGDFPEAADSDCGGGVAHWSHPFGRQAMASWMLRTTPGLMVVLRGSGARWFRHGQRYTSWPPVERWRVHPLRWSALRITRRAIDFI
jgi:hypothetical protein